MPNRKEHPNITVLGAGRWGTAMAIYLSRLEHPVTLQCHTDEEYNQLMEQDTSPRLPGFDCGKKIQFVQDLNESVKNADIIVLAIPVPFLHSALSQLTDLSEDTIIVGINKGLDKETLQTVPEIVEKLFPRHHFSQLGGPCFPQGLLSATDPAAETIACKDDETGKYLQEVFSSPMFRVYRSQDVQGVALLGAMKNVYAIGAGIIDGLGLSEESLSVLITRGLAEMRRLCRSFNIQDETLYGLSGLGDLALTCYSPGSSHNKNFGREIGKGKTTEQVLSEMHGAVAEGYHTAQVLWKLAEKHDVELPLAESIYGVLFKNMSVREGIIDLMQRPLKKED